MGATEEEKELKSKREAKTLFIEETLKDGFDVNKILGNYLEGLRSLGLKRAMIIQKRISLKLLSNSGQSSKLPITILSFWTKTCYPVAKNLFLKLIQITLRPLQYLRKTKRLLPKKKFKPKKKKRK